MISVRDYAVDSFEAALAMLCGAYVGAGLTEAEVRSALDRRLRSLDRARGVRDQAEGGTASSRPEGGDDVAD